MSKVENQRFKTEIQEQDENRSSSASKRCYNYSNSKSAERGKIQSIVAKLLRKSNENVVQLINMWNIHKHSLSISNAVSNDFQLEQTRISVQFNDQLKVVKEKNQNTVKDLLFPITEHEKKEPKQSISQYIKQHQQIDYKQSTKENSRKISRPKIGNSIKFKKTKEFENIVTQLQNIQKSVLNLYNHTDKIKGFEIEKKIGSIISQLEKDQKQN